MGAKLICTQFAQIFFKKTEREKFSF